jgi:hypothetical protein
MCSVTSACWVPPMQKYLRATKSNRTFLPPGVSVAYYGVILGTGLPRKASSIQEIFGIRHNMLDIHLSWRDLIHAQQLNGPDKPSLLK